MLVEKPELLIAVDADGRGEVLLKTERQCPTCGHNAKQLTVYDGKTTCSACPVDVMSFRIGGMS